MVSSVLGREGELLVIQSRLVIRISAQPLNPEFYRGVEIWIKFHLVALRALVCEQTKFPPAAALASEPLLP